MYGYIVNFNLSEIEMPVTLTPGPRPGSYGCFSLHFFSNLRGKCILLVPTVFALVKDIVRKVNYKDIAKCDSNVYYLHNKLFFCFFEQVKCL